MRKTFSGKTFTVSKVLYMSIAKVFPLNELSYAIYSVTIYVANTCPIITIINGYYSLLTDC